MSPEQHRLRFHAWLIAAGLDEETADAILSGMSPYPWHEIATKADLATLRGEVTGLRTEMYDGFADIGTEMRDEFANVRSEMRDGFSDIRTEMAGLRTDVRTMMFALVGFIVAVLVAGAATAVSVAV